jgi:DNA-binding TFAR19-related protein (PDSD5 family)
MSENSDGGDNRGSECFGSSLKMDSTVALMEARSESFASNNSAENSNQKENIMSLAMTPEGRRRLEEEI